MAINGSDDIEGLGQGENGGRTAKFLESDLGGLGA